LGEASEAEAILHKLRDMEPDNFYANMLLGDIYMLKNEITKAETFYSIAFDRKEFPKSNAVITSLFNYAQIYHFGGKKHKAAFLLRMVLSIDSSYYQPYIFLGDIYLSEGNADKAIEYFKYALSLKNSFVKDDPNTVILHYNLSKAYILKGDKANARKNLEIFLSNAKTDRRLQDMTRQAQESLRSLM
jgi:predicted Zn-dependent protease